MLWSSPQLEILIYCHEISDKFPILAHAKYYSTQRNHFISAQWNIDRNYIGNTSLQCKTRSPNIIPCGKPLYATALHVNIWSQNAHGKKVFFSHLKSFMCNTSKYVRAWALNVLKMWALDGTILLKFSKVSRAESCHAKTAGATDARHFRNLAQCTLSKNYSLTNTLSDCGRRVES